MKRQRKTSDSDERAVLLCEKNGIEKCDGCMGRKAYICTLAHYLYLIRAGSYLAHANHSKYYFMKALNILVEKNHPDAVKIMKTMLLS